MAKKKSSKSSKKSAPKAAKKSASKKSAPAKGSGKTSNAGPTPTSGKKPRSGSGALTATETPVIERIDIAAALQKGLRTVNVSIDNQMKEAYLDYAMSVIVGRALPDVRDGLKPVHRRILYAMHERAWRHDRPFVKSAKVVGEVIGNYHPHGDSAAYDTMVRMAQNFVMRVPLVEGQGNFGSIDGDNPAAYRYTEARLTRAAEELLRDIDKNTVDFLPNFDDTKQEPKVLPAALPNLLINGSSGIAVGMATNIPPHNPTEVINACHALIQNPDLSPADLMKHVPAPDFPTGGIIIGGEGLKSAYTTGRGSFRIRAKVDVEEGKKGRDTIVITEIPYQVNKKNLLEKIGELVSNKVIEGIADIKDLSDRHGIRVEIELKKDAMTQIVLNQLFKQTQLQVSYGIIFLALVEGQPRILNLKEILAHYIQHRKEVVVRRTQYELDQAEKRAHILEGLKIALDFIDEVIKIIRGSKTVDEARQKLIKRFKLTEIQANAILDMRLQKLTSLESEKIIEELNQLKEKIKDYKDILKSEKRQYTIVSDELGDMKSAYGANRSTEVDTSSVDSLSFDVTDLIPDEDVVITLTEDGFIKRMGVDSFRRQKRGGRGVRGGSSKREDIIRLMRLGSTHDTLLLFSNKGKVFGIKVLELPEASREARGKSVKALLNLAQEEKITAMTAVKEFTESQAIVMISREGILKKCNLDIFENARKGGIIAINLRKEDELINVCLVNPDDDVIIGSQEGLALRTNLARMRSQGRSAAGIIGMRLDKEDAIVGMDVVKKNSSLFVISEKGFGKRMAFSNFPAKGRGGKGITFMKVADKNGKAVSLCTLGDKDDVLVIAESGYAIRLAAKDISTIGRNTVGVRIVNLSEGDTVRDVAILATDV
ncbi:MAG: DNA gyrase subunit A [Spirochaetaceae bacterium]|nr:DNA gyrase subunit A [Spirochaetaceae bacterium]|tara:strand:- start:16155 stop:18800 length:2646 start_codon:yes stop_codon:yes gene_type:complete